MVAVIDGIVVEAFLHIGTRPDEESLLVTWVDLELLRTYRYQVVNVDGLRVKGEIGFRPSYLSNGLGAGPREAEIGLVVEGLGVDAVIQHRVTSWSVKVLLRGLLQAGLDRVVDS